MGQPSVLVAGVNKKFGLSLKSALKYGLIDSMRRLTGQTADHHLRPGEFWALQNINFSLEPGDALGIMGINGSGKTTLLRILNGTYSPDAGSVTLRGRIGALIAAGAGFSPMLSGRENIYISGTLLGMTPGEIKRKFDEIVAFSELGEFIDMPVRNYSSGMSVRLGFAIAVIGTPEILLVDEVLAVGDIAFQKKCFERINELKKQGTTILLVSHAPGQVWAVCNKGIVIHRGQTLGLTSVEEACMQYEHNNSLERMNNEIEQRSQHVSKEHGAVRGGAGTACITRVEVLDEQGEAVNVIGYAKGFVLRYHLTVQERIEKGILRVLIDSETHKALVIIDNYEIHKELFDLRIGSHVFDIHVKSPNLRPGVYSVSAAIIDKDVGVHIFYEQNHATVLVAQPQNLFFYADFRAAVQLNAEYKESRDTAVAPSQGMKEA
jgi:lipopolysaccharide transport system ATP-binding protein